MSHAKPQSRKGFLVPGCGKQVFSILILAFLFCVNISPAAASWLLDGARFHASAHGQTGCTECHADVMEKQLHPNPANVNRSLGHFFKPEKCFDCHDHIPDELAENSHGGKTIKDPGAYRDCLKCHDPHAQPRVGENRMGTYNPANSPLQQCGACHEKASELPPWPEEDAPCMKCHQAKPPGGPGIKGIEPLCLHCHGQTGTEAQTLTSRVMPLMNPKLYGKTAHASLGCTDCHKNAASYPHDRQPRVDCLSCHPPHDEEIAHDAHVGVSCQACHLQGIVPFRDSDTHQVLARRGKALTDFSARHHMQIPRGETSCKRCHYAGNDLGAVAMVLPPKSILCMPCHTATFSLSDPLSIIVFIIFLLGLALFIGVLLSGTLGDKTSGNPLSKLGNILFATLTTLFSPKIFKILKALFWDALLQRRLYRRSPGRWCIHALIFYGFLFRFCWGIVALVGSLWAPGTPWIWDMINKNHPGTAFLFDLTGLMILSGIVLAWIRGATQKRSKAPGTPDQDRLALGLIGATVLLGFILEGLRMVMTGYPEGSVYAFAGYGVSLLFEPSRGIPEVYSALWYFHAAVTGAFIAYIPFSRLLHMILAPVVISINASEDHGHPAEKPQNKTHSKEDNHG